MLTIWAAMSVLWFFRWLVRARSITGTTAALWTVCLVTAFRLAGGATLTMAVAAGVIVAVAGWLLTWVDDRFHSWASLPLWLVTSMVLFVVLWFGLSVG